LFDIDDVGIRELPSRATIRADGREFRADVRIDTTTELAYFRHGGILPYILRSLAART
jgi:aconitate hydratase